MLWYRVEHKCPARKSFDWESWAKRSRGCAKHWVIKCHVCISRTHTENQEFRRDLESLGSMSETLQQRFSLITGHAHREVPGTQMDVKLLFALGTCAARAGIRPHARTYNFFNQADTLENTQATQNNKSIRKHTLPKGIELHLSLLLKGSLRSVLSTKAATSHAELSNLETKKYKSFYSRKMTTIKRDKLRNKVHFCLVHFT